MRSPLAYWFILVFAPPGQGKSLHQAYTTWRTLKEYYITEFRYPDLPHRIIYTNQKLNYDVFSKKAFWFIKWFLIPWRTKLSDKFVKSHILEYVEPDEVHYCRRINCWKSTTLHTNHDFDWFVDEGGRMWPPEEWNKREVWLRDMWTYHRHLGIRLLVFTQDYEMMDINVRRVVWRVYHMEKWIGSRDPSPTLPKLRKWTLWNFIHPKRNVVWGLYTLQEFSPLVIKLDTLALLTVQMQEDKAEMYKELNLMRQKQYYLITWFKVSLYDTRQEDFRKVGNYKLK